MTQLERLLVACMRWDAGVPDADMAGLAVAADWLEEQGDARAAQVREALAYRMPAHNPAASGPRPSPIRGVHIAPMKSPRASFRWRIWSALGDGAEEIATLECGKDEGPAGHARAERLARWYAACHVLGYPPLRLLACCASGAVTHPAPPARPPRDRRARS